MHSNFNLSSDCFLSNIFKKNVPIWPQTQFFSLKIKSEDLKKLKKKKKFKEKKK